MSQKEGHHIRMFWRPNRTCLSIAFKYCPHTPSWDDLRSCIVGWTAARPQELSIWHHVWQTCWPNTRQKHPLIFWPTGTHTLIKTTLMLLLLSILGYTQVQRNMARHSVGGWEVYAVDSADIFILLLPSKTLSSQHKAALIGWASLCLPGPRPNAEHPTLFDALTFSLCLTPPLSARRRLLLNSTQTPLLPHPNDSLPIRWQWASRPPARHDMRPGCC